MTDPFSDQARHRPNIPLDTIEVDHRIMVTRQLDCLD